MQFPNDVKYHEEHTWARIEGGEAVVGITDYAQDELGDIVYVELPEEGRELDAGEVFGAVESSKSVSELFTPVAGTVVEVHSRLEDEPELINDDPFGSGWMMRVRLADGFDDGKLMDASAYEASVG